MRALVCILLLLTTGCSASVTTDDSPKSKSEFHDHSRESHCGTALESQFEDC